MAVNIFVDTTFDNGETKSRKNGLLRRAPGDFDSENLELFLDDKLCCTKPFRDSSRETSMVAWLHEQTDTTDLQDEELASL